MNDLELCVSCKTTRTLLRNSKGEPECCSCGNEKYFGKLSSGQIIELKIDTTKVLPSTLLQIRTLIQKDMEASLPQPPKV